LIRCDLFFPRESPEHSLAGIVVAIAAIVVMPVLGRAKRDVARQLGSAAMHSDAKQADFCMYLSAILLGGLVLNVWLGWWWADPLAALHGAADRKGRHRGPTRQNLLLLTRFTSAIADVEASR
jgi:divalent metal cation (Fe/Co/Zn/Cd) transporter